MEAEHMGSKSVQTLDSPPENSTPVVDGATTGLVMQMMRVLNLYSEIYGLISAEDKEAESQMRQYGEVFSATDKNRIADIHTDLVMGAFRDRPHSYIGMPHLLKKRLASLTLQDVELGSNLLDENGRPKNKGVYLPLGPIWRMAVKLHERAKKMIKAGSEKIEKTDLMHTGMHQLFHLVIQHLEPLMEDEKALRSCKHAISWYHEYRILCKSEEGSGASFSDAIRKARGIMSGPMISQIISGAGLGDEVDKDQIKGVIESLFGTSDDDNGEMEDIFSQISSGELDPNTISMMVSKISSNLTADDNDSDGAISEFEEYDEVVRYENDD